MAETSQPWVARPQDTRNVNPVLSGTRLHIPKKKPKEFSKRKEKNTWYFLSNFIYYIMLAELPK